MFYRPPPAFRASNRHCETPFPLKMIMVSHSRWHPPQTIVHVATLSFYPSRFHKDRIGARTGERRQAMVAQLCFLRNGKDRSPETLQKLRFYVRCALISFSKSDSVGSYSLKS